MVYKNEFVFTGDSLLYRVCGRTDFQSGNPKDLFHSVKKIYKLLPDDCIIYPGHDYNGNLDSTIGEEKKYNKRIFENQTEEKFIEIMCGLNLKFPEKFDISVPSNLLGGIVWTKPNKICEGIFCGAHTNKQDLHTLKDNGVKIFINLMGKDEITFDENQEEVKYYLT
jgi:glyoxylase-like metal-dependent hydrolase (beta-lactamase superfamily II)